MSKTLEEEYIEFFKKNVMPDGEFAKNGINGPYDTYFGIPHWKEMLSLRNELMDETSPITQDLKEKEKYEEALSQLKVITLEEFIEYKNQNKDE